MNLGVVETSEGKCTMMEGEAKCVKDTQFLECVRVGLEYSAEIAGQIDMVGDREGKKTEGGKWHPNEHVGGCEDAGQGKLEICRHTLSYTLDKLGRDKRMSGFQ